MPLSRQRRAVSRCIETSQSAAFSGRHQAGSPLTPVVPGFRYLLRRSNFIASLSVAVSLFAVTLCTAPAQARKSVAKKATSGAIAKPNGFWAWTKGSATYVRARPGVQTPPVAKVAKHTKLFVWGKFNGWYRVETTDHTFGWIHGDYLNSANLGKAHEMSHFAAKKASDRTEHQKMYGSVELLKKHYQRYGAAGAKKGLASMGVKVGSTSRTAKAPAKAKPQSKTAKAAPVKPAPKVAAVQPQPAKSAPVAKAPVRGVTAKPLAAKPVAAKPVAAKPVARPKVAAQPKPAVTVAVPIPVAEATGAPMTAKPAALPSGSPLHPSLPNPTLANNAAKTKVAQPAVKPKPVSSARVRSLAPAIPLTSRGGNAKSHTGSMPRISPEELLRARQEYLRQRTAPVAPVSEPEEDTGTALFIPSSYARPALPNDHFSPRDEQTGRGFRPLTLDLDYARPQTRFESDVPPALLQVQQTDKAESVAASPKPMVAKNAAPIKMAVPKVAAAKSTPAKPAASKAAPSRGGSPRDLLAANPGAAFGAGLANSALSYRGRPYIRGAASPSRGFDCSGLVYYVLKQRGITAPRTAAGQARYGKPVPMGQLKAGDLVFFANTYKRGVSHVGIYMGNNKFVHAATSGSGVRVDSLGSPYYARKYYGARRVK